MTTVIEASGLRRSFGDTVAVRELDLQVRRGEIFGLVGPDGAGKTTTFRLLLGLLAPETGEVRLGGFGVRQEAQRARGLCGYVAQNFTLYADLTCEENMRFVADLRNLPRGVFQERKEALLELTELAPFRGRLAGNLSGGMKRKLALACALVPKPEIVLLDEPTTGVDPVSRREFWRLLYGLPAEGVTLVVSTPYLDEAERCHRLGFMGGGRLLAVDTPRGLLSHMPDALLDLRAADRMTARRLLKERPDVRRVETVGGALRLGVAPATAADGGAGLCAWLRERGAVIESCGAVQPTLQDVFTALSGAGEAQ
jgi:ABC-2 type transport system ATP-binding protein